MEGKSFAGSVVVGRARGMSAAVEKVFRGVLPQAPPLPLVAFVGKPQVHKVVGNYLRSRLFMNSVGVTEAENARKLFPPRKNQQAEHQEGHGHGPGDPGDLRHSGSQENIQQGWMIDGCVKTRWFEKHRKCHPACVVLFLSFEDFSGDPQQWTECCSAVDQVSQAAKQRDAKVCVCVLASKRDGHELPEDRVTSIKRRLVTDPKYVTMIDIEDEVDLKLLGTLLQELSGMYYRDMVTRLRKKMETVNSLTRKREKQRNSGGQSDIHGKKEEREELRMKVRILVKIGTMCEFVQDWRAALQAYQQAYTCVGDLFSASQNPTGMASVIEDDVCYLQEAREALSVAESLIAKVTTLLLIQHNWVVKNSAQASPQQGQGTPADGRTTSTPHLEDAIQLFQHHINIFRLPLGRNPSLLKHLEDKHGLDLVEVYEAVHWSWVSYQYKKFAKLLMEHVASDLLLKLGAHPSYYLSCAAHYAIMRRQCYESSQSRKMTMEHSGQDMSGSAPGGGNGQLGSRTSMEATRVMFAAGKCRVMSGDYLGQWEISAEGRPKRKMTENEFLCFLEDGETKVNHVEAILEHLNSAQTLYDEIGLRRHKLKIQIELADEYVRIDRIQEAQAILLEVAAVYRREGWDSPLADVVLRLRKCAQLLRKTREHVLHSFELCALENVMEEDQRFAIFQSAQAVLMSQMMTSETNDAVSLMSTPSFEFDMNDTAALKTCFSCTVGFRVPEDQVVLGSGVDVLVALKSKAPLPVEIRALKAAFTDGGCDTVVAAGEGAAQIKEIQADGSHLSKDAIILSPGQYHKFLLQVTPREIGHLKCSRVEVLLGDSALLVWDFEKAALATGGKKQELAMKESGSDPLSQMSGVVPNHRGIVVDDLNLGIKIALSVLSLPLSGGYTRVKADITTDNVKLNSPSLLLSVENANSDGVDAQRKGVDRGVYVLKADGTKKCEGAFQLPSMEPHSHLEQEFLVHCPSDAAFVFLARVTADKVRQSADAAITLKPLPPFNFECALKSCPYEFPMLLGSQVKAKELESLENTAARIPPKENFVVFASIVSSCPSDLEVLSINFDGRGDGVRLRSPEGQYEMPCTLCEQESFGLVGYANIDGSFPGGSFGTLQIRWRQMNEGYGDLVAESLFQLPTIMVTHPPCKVNCSYPTRTIVGEAFPLSIRIENTTHVLQDFDVDMQDGQGFIYSGYKSTKEQVLPHDTNELTWNLVPVATGMMKLPTVRIRSAGQKVELSVPVSHGNIFVRPQQGDLGLQEQAHVVVPAKPRQDAAPPAAAPVASQGNEDLISL
ncbi:subunit 11 of trafficking protein particle complex [Chloropicon primus]|nr:subunit 11 of trafficking protein particle complex [Chloropicon primus]